MQRASDRDMQLTSSELEKKLISNITDRVVALVMKNLEPRLQKVEKNVSHLLREQNAGESITDYRNKVMGVNSSNKTSKNMTTAFNDDDC